MENQIAVPPPAPVARGAGQGSADRYSENVCILFALPAGEARQPLWAQTNDWSTRCVWRRNLAQRHGSERRIFHPLLMYPVAANKLMNEKGVPTGRQKFRPPQENLGCSGVYTGGSSVWHSAKKSKPSLGYLTIESDRAHALSAMLRGPYRAFAGAHTRVAYQSGGGLGLCRPKAGAEWVPHSIGSSIDRT